MMQTYRDLIEKLDAFIRKYYANQLLKGVLLFGSLGMGIYLVLVLGEYFLYLPAVVKLPLVILFLLLAIYALGKFILVPLMQMQRLGKRINYEQAAAIIGQHFQDVDDKIINVLQLQGQTHIGALDTSLLEASIQQKSNQLISLPFVNAINVQSSKKLIPWFIGIGIILLLGALILPQVFQTATNRWLQPTTNFTPPAPFQFSLQSGSQQATLWQPHDIVVQLAGDKLPEEVSIIIDGERIFMTSIGDFKFKYTITKVNKAHEFYFEAVGYSSDKYKLAVNFLPIIDAIKVHLNYPKHIKKDNETLQVFSDLQVPEGTLVQWEIQTQHTGQVQVILDSIQVLEVSNDKGLYRWEKQIVSPVSFMVLLAGTSHQQVDTFRYVIEVIKDQAPTLDIQVQRDTVIGDQIVFSGIAADDYGLQRLSFVCEILNEQGKVIQTKSTGLNIDAPLASKIQHYIDTRTIERPVGSNLKMYIQACDNDIINGGKCVTSAPVYLKNESKQNQHTEHEEISENAAKLQESLNSSKSQQQSMQKDLEQLKSKMLESKTMDWQQQQELERIAEEQQQMKEMLEAVRKRMEEQQRKTEQLELSPSLQEKQEEVKKQLNQMIDKELQDQLKKLEELRQQKNPQQAFEQMQQMEQQNKLFQMNMERVQALIQQLELQLAMELMAEQLDQFTAAQEKILEQTEQGKLGDAAAKEQNQLQQKFDQAMNKAVQDLKAKEEEAKDKDGTSNDLDQAADQVSKDMQGSEDQLKSGQQKGAQQKQQQAIQKMKQMAQKLKEQAGGMDMEQIDIDIKATRQLLTNLIRFSFDQEQLILKVKNTPTHSPLYVELAKEQGRLAANAKMMKDSLFSLSKRVFQIASNVNKETTELEFNIKQALSSLQDRQTSSALVRQQYAMTNANNLALILNELLENLMQDAAQMSGSEGAGKKGQGQPSSGKGNQKGEGKGKGQGQGQGAGDQLSDIITKQQKLGQGMQQGSGQQGKQDGQGQGQGQKGQNGQGTQGQGSGGGSGSGQEYGEYGDAKELARMAREQAQLRQQINQLNTLLNSKGIKGLGKEMTELQKLMDKNETDLVNRRLSKALLLRQQEIMTKLLETEKAVREQEQDDKRQGNTAKDVARPMPPELKKFLQDRDVLLEQYKTQSPEWKPFYKKLNENYLQKVK